MAIFKKNKNKKYNFVYVCNFKLTINSIFFATNKDSSKAEKIEIYFKYLKHCMINPIASPANTYKMSQPQQRNNSCCSFCRDGSHNIRGCNHHSIGELYNKFNILFTYACMFEQSEEITRNMFVNTMCRSFTIRELKVVAVRFAGARTDQTKLNFAFFIWQYFFNIATVALQTQGVNPDIAQQEQVRYFNQVLADVEGVLLPHQQPVADADETDDFIPINLNPAFDAAATPVKKYHINPILFCSETDEELEEVSECAVCYDSVKLLDSVTLNCDHQFCGGCIKNLCQIVQKRHLNCPLCREQICSFIVKSDELLDSVAENCIV